MTAVGPDLHECHLLRIGSHKVVPQRRSEALAAAAVSGDALDEKVIEAKGSLKKLMTGDEVTELLSSLEMGGEPVWGLSTKERRLVREAKEKIHAV